MENGKKGITIQPRNLTNIPQPGDAGGKSTAMSHVDSMGHQCDKTGMLMGSTVSSLNLYTQVLTPKPQNVFVDMTFEEVIKLKCVSRLDTNPK